MITYQQEFLDNCRQDCEELIQLHWEEIALNKGVIKLNPDWESYEALEESGTLKIFTARDGSNLVGYFVVLVGRSLHYKDHIFAENDIIYLHKDYRKGYTGIKLIKFAEKCLKEDGVSILKVNTKVHQPFDTLMSFLKFNLIERVYTKYLGD
jgi:hypothetical protein